METENIRRTASAMMRAAKVTPPTAYKGRFVLTLLLMLLATTTAWADAPSKLYAGDDWDDETKTLTINSNPGRSGYECEKEILHLVINPGVESLSESSFQSCSNLQDVTFAVGATLSRISSNAFLNCTSLTEITIPASVTTIGNGAFNGCTNLESVTFATGSNLEAIGDRAFIRCTKLESVTFADNSKLKTIGEDAFWGCTALTSITIPASVTDIFPNAFQGCTSLQAFNVDENNQEYSSEDGVLFNKAKTILIQYPAGKSETSYTVPSSVTTIKDRAFKGCTYLTSITIPASVTTICMDAFEDTGWYNSQANGPLYLSGWLLGYKGDMPASYALEIDNDTRGIANCAFDSFDNLSSVTITASVTTIGYEAFNECTALGSVTFADGSKLETIGAWAFEDCIALENITIPASVTSIDGSAFNECTALKNVTFADDSKLKGIGDCAFYGCTALTNITIPASVTSIGYGAFGWCTDLTDIYCYANPAGLTWINIADEDTFIRDGKTYIHVSADKLSELTNNEYIQYVGDLGDLLKANAVGNTCWTTFYDGTQGNKIADTENACAYTATVGTDEIILHKLGKVIPAGTAVIIAGEDGIINMTVSAETVSDMPANNLRGVDVRTETSTLGTGTFYVMGKKGDDFGFFEYTGDYMPARKAYLLVNGGAAPVKGLTMVFDGSEDADSLNEELRMKSEEFATAKGWYSLDGRKLDGKPTAKGIVIQNGKKVVVK